MMEELKLPISLQSRADLSRLIRELGSLDSYFLASKLRQAGDSTPPRLTRLLNEVVESNQINLLDEAARTSLKKGLEQILSQAPNLHISFAAEPSPKILQEIVGWLRQNIHHQTMVVVGLQPEIAGGMIVRTPNKIFDLSMKSYLTRQQPYLIKLIDEVARG